jgi:hypothetical protein
MLTANGESMEEFLFNLVATEPTMERQSYSMIVATAKNISATTRQF